MLHTAYYVTLWPRRGPGRNLLPGLAMPKVSNHVQLYRAIDPPIYPINQLINQFTMYNL
jgi:hypothetical protein